MSDMRPLIIQDQELVADYFQRYPAEISEHTFTNLFVWQNSRPISLLQTADSLLFLADADPPGRYLVFGPPLGDLSLAGAIDFLGEKFAGAIRLPEEFSTSAREPEKLMEDRDNSDYVYRVADLAELAGRRYAKKRNQIKKCLQAGHCEYEPISSANIEECAAMQEKWCRVRNCEHDPGLCGEFIAISETFAHFARFNLLGGAIRVDGVIQAYAIGEWLRPGTAVWHFEKAMPEIPGLGQLINQWFAGYGLSGFEFVNREQDLGIPGLRQAKKSYYPHHLVKKYRTIPEDTCMRHVASRGVCP